MTAVQTAAVIVAGGSGSRFGGGKQFAKLGGRPLIDWSLDVFGAQPDIGAIALVLPAEVPNVTVIGSPTGTPVIRAAGGATRQESVRNGLEALVRHRPKNVLIHDAARPLVSSTVIGGVLSALDSAPAALPVVPVTDTLKRGALGNAVQETVPRDGLWRAQTPQGFHFDAILAAHRKFADGSFTDDAAIAEAAGIPVTLVEGDPRNIKITVRDDLILAEALLRGGVEKQMITVTGQGFDVHRLISGDGVWLCGIKVPGSFALLGHSDADCGLHALTDAVLGAIGAGDIGMHFPPSDERWKGAASDKFLLHALELVREAGGKLVHADVTLICERPKIAPHRAAMRARIAEITGLPLARVSVKATTTEELGFTGRREGIAAQAVATVAVPAG
jgi:2-C-methyl-D-erythritol 4-phosphate cytidylyltransferase / 2-C-methyl-D-erythritol 2,4-cyclodiphosphate synthase